MLMNIIKPSDPQFRKVPHKIEMMISIDHIFKDYIGVINETHMPIMVHRDRQTSCIGRNVMVGCGFNVF